MDIIIREAIATDIPFLADVIVEAEKAGTEIFSYTTIFGLTEMEARKYIVLMLEEEIDGCELSVSSFLVAEFEGIVIAALSAWVEGSEGIPSSILKGNLLNYVLPKECIERAIKFNEITRELHFENIVNTIQIGVGYVVKEFRGNNILNLLNYKLIEKLKARNPEVMTICAQIFSCNLPSLASYKKQGFSIVSTKECSNVIIKKLLPSNIKYLLTKKLNN
ncbi:MAG: GNAT family N-acetyltransferase [Flavobacterium sp.]